MKLTPEQEAEWKEAFKLQSGNYTADEIQPAMATFRRGYAAGLAARERETNTEGAAQSQEPVAVAYRVIGEGGMPMTDWIDGDTSDPPAFPNGWIQRAYAAPPAAPKDAEDRT